MDYEKKYKDLIKAVKMLQEANPSDKCIQNWVNDNVPELKRSEEEKIRKELVNYFTEGREFLSLCSFGRDEILSWLEKQGKSDIDCPQNHQDSSRPNGCIVLEDINGGEGFYKLNLDYLNKKQVEEIEEMVRTWNAEKKELKKIENPAAWSEEDENNLTDTCVAIRKFYHGTNGAQELIDWLKSIKQRMKGE